MLNLQGIRMYASCTCHVEGLNKVLFDDSFMAECTFICLSWVWICKKLCDSLTKFLIISFSNWGLFHKKLIYICHHIWYVFACCWPFFLSYGEYVQLDIYCVTFSSLWNSESLYCPLPRGNIIYLPSKYLAVAYVDHVWASQMIRGKYGSVITRFSLAKNSIINIPYFSHEHWQISKT